MKEKRKWGKDDESGVKLISSFSRLKLAFEKVSP